jgi:regulator of protease activity HflC (stomatin/prohibitin superfamily)
MSSGFLADLGRLFNSFEDNDFSRTLDNFFEQGGSAEPLLHSTAGFAEEAPAQVQMGLPAPSGRQRAGYAALPTSDTEVTNVQRQIGELPSRTRVPMSTGAPLPPPPYPAVTSRPNDAPRDAQGPAISSAAGLIPCFNCCIAVPQDKWVIMERFGKADRLLESGLTIAGIDACGCCIAFRSVSARVEQNLCNVRSQTKDNVFVTLKVAIQQVVAEGEGNIWKAMYVLEDVYKQVDAFVAAVVRTQVPHWTIDELFEHTHQISQEVEATIRKQMDQFGFHVLKALIIEVTPNADVMSAMNEVYRQKLNVEAVKLMAEAQKIKVIKEAEALADRAHLEGQGMSRCRAAIIDGLYSDVRRATKKTCPASVIMELFLLTQHFDTLRLLGRGKQATAIFIPQEIQANDADFSEEAPDVQEAQELLQRRKPADSGRSRIGRLFGGTSQGKTESATGSPRERKSPNQPAPKASNNPGL